MSVNSVAISRRCPPGRARRRRWRAAARDWARNSATARHAPARPPPAARARRAESSIWRERLGDGGFQVGEIDRLGQKIERAAVHGGADIAHVAIGRDDDGRNLFARLLQLLQQRQPVHPRHVDIGDDHVDVAVAPRARPAPRRRRGRNRRRTTPSRIWRRNFCRISASRSGSSSTTRMVRGHAAADFSSRVSISLRSSGNRSAW